MIIFGSFAFSVISIIHCCNSIGIDNKQDHNRLEQLHGALNVWYDTFKGSPVKKNETVHRFYKLKRCLLLNSGEVIDGFVNKEWNKVTKGRHVYVQSSCIEEDSVGNLLGTYFENVICAQLTGIDYVAVAKTFNTNGSYVPPPFINRLPDYIEHTMADSPVPSFQEIKTKLNQNCKCNTAFCWESSTSAWVQGLPTIKRIFIDALLYHLESLAHTTGETSTIVRRHDLFSPKSNALGLVLPLIPDVAIHYRCGDNFGAPYGFIPFEVLKDRIVAAPDVVHTIYVLAEHRGRKTKDRPYLAVKCDIILNGLFEYLVENFPSAHVVVKRGSDDMFLDLARLTFAKTTICSISTFCLWPAVASNGTAFVPQTKLIVGGNTNINLGFQWMIVNTLVLAERVKTMQGPELLALLLKKKKS